jgi:hypothetical protein
VPGLSKGGRTGQDALGLVSSRGLEGVGEDGQAVDAGRAEPRIENHFAGQPDGCDSQTGHCTTGKRITPDLDLAYVSTATPQRNGQTFGFEDPPFCTLPEASRFKASVPPTMLALMALSSTAALFLVYFLMPALWLHIISVDDSLDPNDVGATLVASRMSPPLLPRPALAHPNPQEIPFARLGPQPTWLNSFCFDTRYLSTATSLSDKTS